MTSIKFRLYVCITTHNLSQTNALQRLAIEQDNVIVSTYNMVMTIWHDHDQTISGQQLDLACPTVSAAQQEVWQGLNFAQITRLF